MAGKETCPVRIESYRLRSGLVFLAVGIALVGAQTLFEYTRHYTAVNIPVQKTPATIRTGTFTLNYPGLYMIEYRVARALPDRELACRLGVDDVERKQCPNGQPHVATSWVLRNDGGIVAQGDSDDWPVAESSSDDLSAEIGIFRAGSFMGQQYRLEVTIRNHVPGPETAKPALVVELHPILDQGRWSLAF